MINLTNEGPVEKEIQLKKRTILKIVGRSDFGQNRRFGIDMPTQVPTEMPTTDTKLPPTVGTFK